jgi:type II secretory pathway predicted ATPase ExeA
MNQGKLILPASQQQGKVVGPAAQLAEVPSSESTKKQVRMLRSFFGFSRIPFPKGMCAANMFDSAGQRDLVRSLLMWTEVRGTCLITGSCGVGKSLSLRRFRRDLESSRFQVIDINHIPTSVFGFLRSLCRALDLPMQSHAVDLFDAAQKHLASYEQDHASHPILFIDDAEGMRPEVLDTIRRLTCHDLDSEDRFSILLSGTDALPSIFADPALASLRSRISYVYNLRPFGLEDTTNYIRFHLQRAELEAKVFSDAAIKRIFQATHGYPRSINQLAIQAMIQAAVAGRESIDGDLISGLVATHPLYQHQGAER